MWNADRIMIAAAACAVPSVIIDYSPLKMITREV